MPHKEIGCQGAKIMQTQLVQHDRAYLFHEDVISDETGVLDPQFPILAKVSSLLKVLLFVGSYEKLEQF